METRSFCEGTIGTGTEGADADAEEDDDKVGGNGWVLPPCISSPLPLEGVPAVRGALASVLRFLGLDLDRARFLRSPLNWSSAVPPSELSTCPLRLDG